MTFLTGRGWVDADVRERYELETVARIRRVGNHPSFEAVIVALNLVLARMENELTADAKGLPQPFPTVETSIKQILWPLEKGGSYAGLGKVYRNEAEYRRALESWSGISGAESDAAEPLDEETLAENKEASETAVARMTDETNRRMFAPTVEPEPKLIHTPDPAEPEEQCGQCGAVVEGFHACQAFQEMDEEDELDEIRL